MKKKNLNFPLYCVNCKEKFSTETFLNIDAEPYLNQLEQIIDYCLYERLKQELEFLIKAEEMYIEFPESKEKMVPKIFLRNNSAPTSEEIKLWTKGDKKLEEFLLTSYFNQETRKSYVEQCIKEEYVEPVICPKCRKGTIVFEEGRLSEYEPKLT